MITDIITVYFTVTVTDVVLDIAKVNVIVRQEVMRGIFGKSAFRSAVQRRSAVELTLGRLSIVG
jgi:hypothetical protein